MTIRNLACRISLAACLVALGGRMSYGQQPSDEATPTLPETNVVAELEAPQFDQPLPPQNFNAGAGVGQPSVLEGSIFASPDTRGAGYGPDFNSTGAGINIADIDFPGTVSVVTQDLRRDQQVIHFDELLRDVGGAVKSQDNVRPDAFVLRGFEMNSRDFRKNGFLDPTFSPRDFANVDRVEVLKGPASMLYGPGSPSGVVNLITKKPLPNQFNEATFQFGSFGLQRYTIDTTGKMNQSGSLLYRINAAYQETETFRDFGFQRRSFFAPAVSWVASDDTIFTWEAEILDDRRRFDTGLVAIGGNPEFLPRERFLGEPDNDFQQFNDYRQSLTMTHRLNDDWTVKLGGYSLFYDAPSSSTIPDSIVPNTTLVNRVRTDTLAFDEEYHSIIATLAGETCIAGYKHNLLFGTEQGWFVSDRFTTARSATQLQPLTIDAVNPVYTDPAAFTFTSFDAIFRENRHGFYTQDLMELNRNWSVMAGVRYDTVQTQYYRALPPLGFEARTQQHFDKWSPRVGLIYQPIPDVLSYYAMYSKSFVPPGGGSFAPNPLKPELGDIFEGGVKTQLLDNLMVTAGAFYIVRQNVSFLEFGPFGFQNVQVAEQRSQGLELNVLGEVTERFSINANYAYTDSLIFDPFNRTRDLTRPRNVPYHTGNLWARYNAVQNCQQTIGAALGLVGVGDRFANSINSVELPAYARWDAGLFWQRDRWDASLYVENIFDEVYTIGSVNELQIYPGAPTNARVQVSVYF